MFKTINLGKRATCTVVRFVSPAPPATGKRATKTRKGARANARTKPALISAFDPGFRGEAGECRHESPALVIVGCGDAAKLNTVAMRSIGGKLIRFLDRRATGAIRFDFGTLASDKATRAGWVQALAEGMAISNWRFDRHDGTATKRQKALNPLKVSLATRADSAAFSRGLAIAQGVNLARTIGATPPNICHPGFVAAECKRIARECGLGCRVITAKQAKVLGMGALLAVGQGSSKPPCLVHLSYKPRRVSRAARRERLVLVGKTVTYDTGGYSLKINNGMKGMKYDKAGGMCVLGAMRAIAALKPGVEVHAVLAAAENMISDDSYRPDDIITASNGVSIEVTNTDAEGRLVLADALVWACKTLKPTAVVDFATLTGGVVVALGSFCAGYFCNDDGLRAKYESAACASGEKIWRLPLWPEHRDHMRSQHADILNSAAARGAHPIQGAAFLSYFVPETTPWCHVDIAGVANLDSGNECMPAGPTGYGVRTIVELATSME